MSALARWHDELANGERTRMDWDALFVAACKEAEDAEMYAYLRPARQEVQRLKALDVAPAGEPLHELYPALDQWRQRVLEHGGSPLEVAAAWEITALSCECDGAHDLVDECYANAAAALGVAA